MERKVTHNYEFDLVFVEKVLKNHSSAESVSIEKTFAKHILRERQVFFLKRKKEDLLSLKIRIVIQI
jgi:hypothetical protein